MRKICMFLSVILIATLLMGCNASNAILLDLSDVKTDPERFVWGSYSDIDVSLGDVGLFYCKDNTLRYYDMEEQDEYILCSRANCRHDSDACSAYFSSDIYGKGAENVAQIDNYVYCTYSGIIMDDYESRNGKSLQLLRIDLTDGTRKVVAEFPCVNTLPADADNNAFFAEYIVGVDYCNGWAWCEISMSQPAKTDESELSYVQFAGVNLESGEIRVLNKYDDWTYELEFITADNIFLNRRRETDTPLSQNEYYAQYGDGIANIDGEQLDSYSAYVAWHEKSFPEQYEVYAYDIESGEMQILISELTSTSSGDISKLHGVVGAFEGKALFYELQPNESGVCDGNHVAYYLQEMATGEKEWITDLEDGHALNIAGSHYTNKIFSDGTFFYIRYVGADRCDIFSYNFNTNEEVFLFNDDAGVTMRIYGEYKDGYFGKHKDHQYQEGYYWISKEDFYAGNLDAMVHYDAG